MRKIVQSAHLGKPGAPQPPARLWRLLPCHGAIGMYTAIVLCMYVYIDVCVYVYYIILYISIVYIIIHVCIYIHTIYYIILFISIVCIIVCIYNTYYCLLVCCALSPFYTHPLHQTRTV